MKKKSTIITIIKSLFIAFLIYLISWFILQMFYPIVGIFEGVHVSNEVKEYLTKKYGNHNFKVRYVEYDFNMEKLFDYSNKVGYSVDIKGAGVNSSVYISGIYPNITSISDSFLKDYYFGEYDSILNGKLEKFRELYPKEKIESVIFNKIKNEFDPNIQKADADPIFDVSDDFGRIPTIEEIQNNLNFYFLRELTYSTTLNPEEKESYKVKLKDYVTKNFGNVEYCYIREKDNIYHIGCDMDSSFNVGDVTNN